MNYIKRLRYKIETISNKRKIRRCVKNLFNSFSDTIEIIYNTSDYRGMRKRDWVNYLSFTIQRKLHKIPTSNIETLQWLNQLLDEMRGRKSNSKIRFINKTALIHNFSYRMCYNMCTVYSDNIIKFICKQLMIND